MVTRKVLTRTVRDDDYSVLLMMMMMMRMLAVMMMVLLTDRISAHCIFQDSSLSLDIRVMMLMMHWWY
jgi:hypothetical protein